MQRYKRYIHRMHAVAFPSQYLHKPSSDLQNLGLLAAKKIRINQSLLIQQCLVAIHTKREKEREMQDAASEET